MGVGKSTVGKKLASRLGYKFIDTDKEFERRYKLSINDFFNKYGETLFRKLEQEILELTFQYENCVISTGGGLPCQMNAMKKINENGTSIFMKMDEGAIYSRLVNSKQKRPLVLELSELELRDTIARKLAERNQYYQLANITIPALSINLDDIIDKIRSK